jgi:hypothetical protein
MENEDELHRALPMVIQRAQETGLHFKYVAKLTTMVSETFLDLWRVRLQGDPPANVSPLKIRLKEGSRPVRFRARRYKPEQSKFLKEYVKTLMDMGYCKRNPHCQWSGFPMTIDLRLVIDVVEMGLWPMPF